MRKKDEPSQLSEEEKQKAQESYTKQLTEVKQGRNAHLLQRDLVAIEGLLALVANMRNFVMSYKDRFYEIFNSNRMIEIKKNAQKKIYHEFEFEQDRLNQAINLLRQAMINVQGIIPITDDLMNLIEKCQKLVSQLRDEKYNLEVTSTSKHCYQNYVVLIVDNFNTLTKELEILSINFVDKNKASRKLRSDIPTELWIEIFSLLKIKGLGEIAQVTKFFTEVSGDNILWQKQLKEYPILAEITKQIEQQTDSNISYKKLLAKFFNFDYQHFYDYLNEKDDQVINNRLAEQKKIFEEKKASLSLEKQQQIEIIENSYLFNVIDALLDEMKKYIKEDRKEKNVNVFNHSKGIFSYLFNNKNRKLSNLNFSITPSDKEDLKFFSSKDESEFTCANIYFQAMSKIRSIKTKKDVVMFQNWIAEKLNKNEVEDENLAKHLKNCHKIASHKRKELKDQVNSSENELQKIQSREFKKASEKAQIMRDYYSENPNLVDKYKKIEFELIKVYKNFIEMWIKNNPDQYEQHKEYDALVQKCRHSPDSETLNKIKQLKQANPTAFKIFENKNNRKLPELLRILRDEDKASYEKAFEIIYAIFPAELTEYFMRDTVELQKKQTQSFPRI